jgi:hypothetical protein
VSRGPWKVPRGYVPLRVIAGWLQWSERRTIRWGVKEKFLVKMNGQWVSTKRRILLAFPDISADHLQ